MQFRNLFYWLIVPFLISSLIAGCAGQTPAPPTEEPTQVETGIAADPTNQIITFWHAMSYGANLEGMTGIVDEFNRTNEYGISVEAVPKGSQSELETAVNGALATGELPNLTMGFPDGLVRWHSLGAIASLNEYL